MGCNYYIKSTNYHIGKSSAGWCFSLHVDPSNGINNLDDVLRLIGRKKIVNEYGDTVTKQDMIDIITNRSWGESMKDNFNPDCFYNSYEDFMNKNGAEEGPNNLLRHKINWREPQYGISSGCVSHGSGTWDCIVGEFS